MAHEWTVTLPDPTWLEDLGALPEGASGAVWDVQHPPEQAVADAAEVVVLPYGGPKQLDLLTGLPRLRVVQSLSTGYDSVVDELPPDVTLATASGVHDAATAELAVALVLASLRGLDDAVRDAEQGRWRHRRRPSLADRRVLVVGTGGVGAAIADRLAPFEVLLTRVAATPRTDERGVVHGVADLADLLPEHDVVVLAVPLTDGTRGLVGREFLAAMPDGALLVNVARGAVVDTDALLVELSAGRLRAALDVVEPEPLPSEHPLWGAPGLLLTPHVGGDTTAMRPRALALLRDQLDRHACGADLRNVVRR